MAVQRQRPLSIDPGQLGIALPRHLARICEDLTGIFQPQTLTVYTKRLLRVSVGEQYCRRLILLSLKVLFTRDPPRPSGALGYTSQDNLP